MKAITFAVVGLVGAACVSIRSGAPLDISGAWAIDRAATRLQLLKVENLDKATLEIAGRPDTRDFIALGMPSFTTHASSIPPGSPPTWSTTG